MRDLAFNARKRNSFLAWFQVAILVAASMAPFVAVQQSQAAQLGDRFIEMSSSNGGETGVTYSVSFVTSSAADLNGVAIQFCDDSPIIGDGCGTANLGDVSGATISNQTNATFTVDGATDNDTVVLTGTNTSVAADTTVSFDLGGIENPAADNQAFFARIVTYETQAGAQGYTAGSPGTHLDDGGIALSTAQQITVTARVQERLVFCVGNTNPGANCTSVGGSDVDLGVLDNSTVNTASGDGDNTNVAHMQLSTNAVNGATINYYATELQVDGATCSGTDTTDECINEAGATATTITAGDELWGMNGQLVNDDGNETNNLSLDAAYDSADYAMNIDTASTLLADSSTVVDNESFSLDFGATVDATTPTGLYQSTLTFVATGTF